MNYTHHKKACNQYVQTNLIKGYTFLKLIMRIYFNENLVNPPV